MFEPLSGVQALGVSAAVVRDRRGNAFAVGAALVSALLSLTVLIGWLGAGAGLTSLAARLPTMKVNSALGMLALALGVLSLAWGLRAPWRAGAALLAAAIGAVTLFQHLTGIDLGVDNLLVHDSAAPADQAPGRPAPIAALSMLCLAVALVWRGPDSARLAAWRPLPALLAFVLGYVASVGLLLGAEWSGSRLSAFAAVALPTAVCTVLLSAALTVLTPWRGTLLDAVVADSSGAHLLRLTMPALLVMPALIIWLELSLRGRGWWPANVGPVICVVLLALAYLGVALHGARWINRLTAELQAGREQLEQRVTERTAELTASTERLSASRAQLSAVVQSAGAAIVTLDAQQRIVLFNTEAERVFGHSAAAMQGQALDALLPEGLREVHRRHLARFAQHGQSLRRMGGDAELRGLRASGEEFPLAASIARIGEGPDQLLTVVLRDLTEARALQAERTARQAAELSDRAKSEFLSRVSHELRTPLNAVLGFTQLLQTGPAAALGEPQRAWVDHIRTAATHLNMLVSDLLEIGAAEAGAVSRRIETVELPPLVDDAMTMVSAQARASGIALEVRVDPSALLARAPLDRGRALQILTNLLSNAIKYNRPRGRVWLTIVEGLADWRIGVRDTGDGLSAEQVAHLFEPFNRLGREGGEIEGRGLGLVVSQRLATAMGCRIEVASTPGAGSEFVLVTPRTH